MKTLIFVVFTAIACFSFSIKASNYRTILTLSGYWQFNIGDDKKWATPQFDDSNWDKVIVPGEWENQGYIGYDGFAWYRNKFTFPENTRKSDIFVQIGNIDDVDEIYINGRSVGRTGLFPPNYETGYTVERLYKIPEKYLNFFGENTIAVRVYDDEKGGGIISGPVHLSFLENDFDMYFKLNNDWKFTIRDNHNFCDPDFNDNEWKNIKVPQAWQSQGYWGYNGYAWYRYAFELNSSSDLNDLYLVLGRIDDYDETYFNGKQIGRNWSFSFLGELNINFDNTYQILRGYKINKRYFKPGKNVIAIRVLDYGGRGGIYEGPIGFMKKDKWLELKESDEINY